MNFKKIIPMVVLLIIWQVSSLFVKHLFLPSPIEVFKTGIETLKSGLLIKSFFGSFWRITIATLYSGILSILIASLVVNSKTLERIVVPITATSRYIPDTVFYPLLIMWLGIGETVNYSHNEYLATNELLFEQYKLGGDK